MTPRLARLLLERCLPEHLRAAIIGDIEEIFLTVVRQRGRGYAAGWYWNQAIQSLFAQFSGLFRRQLRAAVTEIEGAARSLVRHRRYSVISITSLSTAVTCCLLIALYVAHELSYDRYHTNAARIFQVHSGPLTTIAARLGPGIVGRSPRVESAGLIYRPAFRSASSVVRGHRSELAKLVLYGNSALFDIFSWRFVDRVPGPPLDEPFTVVVTESAAARMFGRDPALGGSIEISDHNYTVTGVIEDPPVNSHVEFDYLASITSADSMLRYFGEYYRVDSWQFNNAFMYLLLDSPQSADSVAAQLAALHAEKADPPLPFFELRPLRSVYLASETPARPGPGGNPQRLIAMAVAFVLLLVVSGLNVVHLAAAAWRLEAGPVAENGRKRWWILFRRFACETFLITVLATTFAMLAARFLLPVFNELFQKNIVAPLGLIPWVTLGVLVFPLIVSVVAASLPAVRSRRPGMPEIPSGRVRPARGGSLPVASQLVVAFAMAMAAAVLFEQVDYLRNKPLGFDTRQLLVVPLNAGRVDAGALDDVREKLVALPGVQRAAFSASVPGRSYIHNRLPGLKSPDGKDLLRAIYLETDPEFLATYHIAVTLDSHPGSPDDVSYLVNETLARAMGCAEPADAIGRQLTISQDGYAIPITGVVRDFHFERRQKAIGPMILIIHEEPNPEFLTVRLEGGHGGDTADRITAELDRLLPGAASYSYHLEPSISGRLDSLVRLKKQVAILAAAILAITYAGLLGYGTFVVRSRREDIRGWRLREHRPLWWILLRLHGVSAAMIVCAAGLAVPAGAILTDKWLSEFAYRVDPGAGLYALTAAFLIAAGLVLVCYPAIRFVSHGGARPDAGYSPLRAVR